MVDEWHLVANHSYSRKYDHDNPDRKVGISTCSRGLEGATWRSVS